MFFFFSSSYADNALREPRIAVTHAGFAEGSPSMAPTLALCTDALQEWWRRRRGKNEEKVSRVFTAQPRQHNTTQTRAFLTYGETVTGRDEYKSQVEQPGRHLPMLCAPILLGEGTVEGVRGEGGERSWLDSNTPGTRSATSSELLRRRVRQLSGTLRPPYRRQIIQRGGKKEKKSSCYSLHHSQATASAAVPDSCCSRVIIGIHA